MSSWFQRVFSWSRADPPNDGGPSSVANTPPARPSLSAVARGDERRSCARVNLELQVRLRFETAEAMIASRTFDISRSGAFITISEPRRRGTRVRLNIEIDDTKVSLGGIVVRACDGAKSSRRGMGIQFTDISPEASEALERLLGPRGG